MPFNLELHAKYIWKTRIIQFHWKSYQHIGMIGKALWCGQFLWQTYVLLCLVSVAGPIWLSLPKRKFNNGIIKTKPKKANSHALTARVLRPGGQLLGYSVAAGGGGGAARVQAGSGYGGSSDCWGQNGKSWPHNRHHHKMRNNYMVALSVRQRCVRSKTLRVIEIWDYFKGNSISYPKNFSKINLKTSCG